MAMYSVSFENVAVTASQDFFELTPADDHPVYIAGLFIDQLSDTGDAAEEFLRWEIRRGHTTGGSGGSAATPVGVDSSSGAANTAAEVNNTTIAANGTTTRIHAGAFNIRAGLAIWFPPEAMPKASQGNTTIVVRLLANPADSLTMSGTLYFEEA